MSAFVKKTIGQLVKETAERYPQNTALVCPDFSIRQTYAEFYQTCRQVAKGLMALGIQRGDNVAVWTTNIPEWAHLAFALGMTGGVLVTVNTNYQTHELKYILKQSDSTTLFLMESYRDVNFYDNVRNILPDIDHQMPGQLVSQDLPALKNIVYIGKRESTPGMLHFDDMVKMGEGITDKQLDDRLNSLDDSDVINMQYTSGTTGFPKGVMLTHHNIVNNARMVGDVMGMTEKDSLLIQVPLFHCFGCVMSTLNCVYHGSTMVIVEFFDPLKALQYIAAEKCTAVNGVPTMFIAILNHPDFDKYDLTSLRTGIMAGAPCPVETMNQVRTKMHCPEIVIAFGQTESAPVMTMTRRDDPVELRVSTVGRLLPDIEGKIIDPDTGIDLPPDTQGEIVTRSECVMKGYYKMPEATAAAIDNDKWLHTGDLGEVDKNGYFKVTGRIKDMIIRGGENIYPRELEEFLFTHPKVANVQVIGLPDKKYGEQVLAAIQLKAGQTATPEEFADYCKGKIARHKIPKYWEFVDGYPMTASGKIQKFKMKEAFEKKYPG
ncbi:MAG: AMP-binding protein [Smithella sp.]|mgnify:FL=1|nr:AMP-binding protein [Smithella sp.]HOU51205.1 AMP-binding protein [Smithella sp.]HQG65829.1 AMP-binding protein [Smithella sp.]HQH16119.1 AMP-binding protein [Smithella sp.]HQI72490.1 AMP-binding protein [Smithella sp.]